MDIIFYAAPVLLFIVWVLVQRWKLRKIHLRATWMFLVLNLWAFGWMTHQNDFECTRLASATLNASTIYLIGPLLIYFCNKKINELFVLAGVVCLAAISSIITIFLLLFSEQIWGL